MNDAVGIADAKMYVVSGVGEHVPDRRSRDGLPAAIELTIPAQARFVASARLVAAALAADLGFSVDDIEELRIGVDEALTLLIEAQPAGASIRVVFTIGDERPGRLTIEGGSLEPSATPMRPAVDALVRRILDAVTDAFEVDADRFVLHKEGTHEASSR
jgi:hypothetical protein